MGKEQPHQSAALQKLQDGTVKQQNMLTGTEVWTVPGRGHRLFPPPRTQAKALQAHDHGQYCVFCHQRYLETPPEKERLVRDDNGTWVKLAGLSAKQLSETTAEFRRIPNLFEIVSYNYWHLNHGHEPSQAQRQRMAEYLSTPQGFDHVMQVVKSRFASYGLSQDEIAAMSEGELLSHATGFFAGGHDLIVPRRHFIDSASDDSQLASSGTLTPEEHFHYTRFTVDAMRDLYDLNSHVRYVAVFQNWLKPAGASLDHLHKQLVAIDEHSVQTQAELSRLHHNPSIYEQILQIRTTRGLVVAQNDYAIAMAGVGHRYPTVAVWPLGPALNPWQATAEQMRGVSDILHAVHAATGGEVPANEEWYHRPMDVKLPMRWRMLVKWRVSTLAGFEGGTRIYLNTIDPWGVRDRMIAGLEKLRENGAIAPMRIGAECQVGAGDLC